MTTTLWLPEWAEVVANRVAADAREGIAREVEDARDILGIQIQSGREMWVDDMVVQLYAVASCSFFLEPRPYPCPSPSPHRSSLFPLFFGKSIGCLLPRWRDHTGAEKTKCQFRGRQVGRTRRIIYVHYVDLGQLEQQSQDNGRSRASSTLSKVMPLTRARRPKSDRSQ